MKNIKGGALAGVLITVGVLAFIAVLLVGTFLSYANKAVDFEANIDKFDRSSQNTLSAYTLRLQEMVQVPSMYLEDFKQVIEATFQGRYGENGSQATFQWIQENNLQFDSSMYSNLQVTITSGRNEFKLSQDRKLEICTDYQKITNRPVSGFFLGVMGYPKVDLSTKCRIVLDTNTLNTFETGVGESLKLR